jgi:hypothetical protein
VLGYRRLTLWQTLSGEALPIWHSTRFARPFQSGVWPNLINQDTYSWLGRALTGYYPAAPPSTDAAGVLPKFSGFALCCRKDVARSASRGTPSFACVFLVAFSAAYDPAAITIEATVNTIIVFAWGKICVGTFCLNLIWVVAVGGNLLGRGHIGSEGKHRDCENSSLGDFHVHEGVSTIWGPVTAALPPGLSVGGCMTFIRSGKKYTSTTAHGQVACSQTKGACFIARRPPSLDTNRIIFAEFLVKVVPPYFFWRLLRCVDCFNCLISGGCVGVLGDDGGSGISNSCQACSN